MFGVLADRPRLTFTFTCRKPTNVSTDVFPRFYFPPNKETARPDTFVSENSWSLTDNHRPNTWFLLFFQFWRKNRFFWIFFLFVFQPTSILARTSRSQLLPRLFVRFVGLGAPHPLYLLLLHLHPPLALSHALTHTHTHTRTRTHTDTHTRTRWLHLISTEKCVSSK